MAAAPGKGGLDIVFATKSTKAANRNAQRLARVLIAPINPHDPFDLLPGKTIVHCVILRLESATYHPTHSKRHADI